MKRVIAHFAFGIGLAGTIGKIASDWVPFQYFVFTLLFSGLLGTAAEAFQSSHNERTLNDNRDLFQLSDCIKNYAGSIVGALLVWFYPNLFWVCLALLISVVGYAIIRMFQKKTI